MLFNTERPTRFSEVIGQEGTLKVLKEQSAQRKFAHTYLLYGHHGCGKTTVARILSRAVECESPTEDGPCGECDACKITASSSPDIIELDAASHNGVEDIRSLIESAKFIPQVLRYKCIIIDEVHMLSTGAFNALLKTLEEPPEHCYFFLCTTEVYKVPATIRSRCQKYLFSAISDDVMAEHLINVAKRSGSELSRDAAICITVAANGAVRDALGFLEQLLAEDGGKIAIEQAQELLGEADASLVSGVIYRLVAGDTLNALKLSEQYYSKGQSIQSLVDRMLSFLSNLLIFKETKTARGTVQEQVAIEGVAKAVKTSKIFDLVNSLSALKSDLRGDETPFLTLQAALITLSCQNAQEGEVELLRKEVKELRSMLTSGAVAKEVTEEVTEEVPDAVPEEVAEEVADAVPEEVIEEAPECDESLDSIMGSMGLQKEELKETPKEDDFFKGLDIDFPF